MLEYYLKQDLQIIIIVTTTTITTILTIIPIITTIAVITIISVVFIINRLYLRLFIKKIKKKLTNDRGKMRKTFKNLFETKL